MSGTWRYNEAQSDDAGKAIPQDSAPGVEPPRGQESGGRGGFGGGGGGRGGGRGRGGFAAGVGGGSDQSRMRIQETVQLAVNPPRLLEIARNDSAVLLIEAGTDTTRLPTNGKKLKESVEGGGEVELKAQWKSDGLVVERKVSGGGKVTETYFLSSEQKQMVVIVKLETSRLPKPVEFRRVYDAVAAGS